MREKVCVSFIGFFELDEVESGEAIAGKIENAIADWHLDHFRLKGAGLWWSKQYFGTA